MRPTPIAPPADVVPILPGASFSDAFAIDLEESGLNAMAAARRTLVEVPGWMSALLKVRDGIVRPFGLRTVTDIHASTPDRCGMFPIISETPSRVILGLNDTHLDFRIVVDIAPLEAGRSRVIATTLVKHHNLFGQAYLATVMPFHKLIVPTLLSRLAA